MQRYPRATSGATIARYPNAAPKSPGMSTTGWPAPTVVVRSVSPGATSMSRTTTLSAGPARRARVRRSMVPLVWVNQLGRGCLPCQDPFDRGDVLVVVQLLGVDHRLDGISEDQA